MKILYKKRMMFLTIMYHIQKKIFFKYILVFVIVYMLYKYLCLCIFGELILLICADNGNNNVNQDTTNLENTNSTNSIVFRIASLEGRRAETIDNLYSADSIQLPKNFKFYYLTVAEEENLLKKNIFPQVDLKEYSKDSMVIYILLDGS
ncbi:MAG: hypothetical protein QW303_06125 [Nitrososphaerota archaeon]